MSALLQPLADRVLVRPQAVRETASGLLIPETAQDKPQRGTVAAAGPDAEVTIGDEIVFSKYGATELLVDGEEMLMLKGDDIVAVVEG